MQRLPPRLAAVTVATLLLGIPACFVETVVGSGRAETEEREVDAFTALDSTSFLAVDIGIGETQSVSVTCDDNLLEYLITDVREGTLHIEQHIVGEEENTYVSLKPSVDCGVELTATSMIRVESSGAGDVQGDGIFNDLGQIVSSGAGAIGLATIDIAELSIELTGVGAVEVSGTTSHLIVENSGSGGLKAKALTAQDADVTTSGVGTVEVTVTGCLNVTLSGVGDVVAAGSPQLCQVDDTGAGQVILE